MDARFYNLGFAANPQSNAFKNLCNSTQIGGNGAEGVYCADTTLRLDSPAFPSPLASTSMGLKRKWSFVDGPENQQVESSLCLHLGHSSSSSDSKGSTATACTSMSSAKETDEESSMDLELDFTLHLGVEKPSFSEKSASFNLKSLNEWPKVDLQLGLSSGPALSDITTVHPFHTATNNAVNMVTDNEGLDTDEGSTGNPFLPLHTARNMENIYFFDPSVGQMKPNTPVLSSSIVTVPKSSVTCTSGITQSQQQRSSCSNSTKHCQFQGCSKGARGASGLCIAHGGGRRCQRPGCHKGAEGRTAFCKAHGGGRRCEFLGCTKSAEGRTDFCIAHGGGRRCSYETCTRAARGKSGLCIRHGGGKRCQVQNCSKSAEGLSGLCISHGGGRRCQYPECHKGAQGSTMFCKAHGGGKRCTHPGCKKGAEGSTSLCKGHGGGKRCSFQGGGLCPKSVHGGTLFCVAHGGGKRCAISECTRSARGRTDFCVRHGGGKRCKYEGCGKSAQGSTDFCKAHGDGKRCSWGSPGSEFGLGDNPCNTFARGKTGLCVSHGALVQDNRVHGGGTVGIVVQDFKAKKPVFTVEDGSVVMNSADCSNYFGYQPTHMPSGSNRSSGKVPEGRVHGGNLMALLAGGPGFNFPSGDMAGPSEPEKSFVTHQTWM
ncbi:hypothetical protein ABFS82_01G066600 [Erythranthe guttata]|uniref:uncharacterized protein LOC105973743 n=1 Tax=Erythranthe guttata TaxID=4155 RepID=UPI00064DA7AB|nr:PREDICTED: uncharacterized protein LOC105973743 [Erythranthe guttata]|eukprot:XP_012854238.1 PREDICTED: uncharacterized protein LOC105973743 [Erythranthe guttata]